VLRARRDARARRREHPVTLVDKQHAIVLLVHTGTNSGKDPSGRLKANGKKFGDLVGQVIELDDHGRARQIQEYFDLATSFGQLDPKKDHPVRAAIDKPPIDKLVATAHGDDTEKANLAAIAKLGAAFDAHDDKALAELVADDVVWSEEVQPKDWTKQELVGNLPKLWKAFPELKSTMVSQSAAGDFVATIESTKLDKASPALSMLVVYQLRGGKIARVWSLFQSQATKK
jgi:ketosteroid isomerase-like protein